MADDSNPGSLFSDVSFDSIDLHPSLRAAVDELGYDRLTKVQAEVLPHALAGRDIVAQAQTGSGKTAAYLLTVFSRLLATPRTAPPESPRALFVAPTRELAVQIAKDAGDLGRHTEFTTHVVFGGLDYRKQRSVLEEGVDLLIGTPGRLIDYHKQRAYSLNATGIVVVDECDRLFDMGFADDLRWLLRRLPRPGERQTLMFTATLSQRVTTLGWREMNDPVEVVIDPGRLTPDTVHQELYHVAGHEKLSLLLGVLEREGVERTMIFVNTRVMARRLVDDLRRHGYAARGLTGNVMQTKRLRVLDDFRDGRLPILVATDVASRGLHIEGVSHVVNFDLPQDPEDYVHRIGRTARVGAEGKAISLACENFVYSLDAIHKYVGYEIPVEFAGDDLYKQVIPHEPRRASGARRGRAPKRTARAAPGEDGHDAGAAPATAPRSGDDGPGDDAKPKRRRRRRRRRPGGGERSGGDGPVGGSSDSG